MGQLRPLGVLAVGVLALGVLALGVLARGVVAARRCGAVQRLVHDAADGARTAPALRAAAEAVIDLPGGAPRRFGRFERGAHVGFVGPPESGKSLLAINLGTCASRGLQFHGREPDNWCAQFGRRFLKAIAMGEGARALHMLRRYPSAAGLLLDGHGLGEAGGSGKAFDWSLMPRDLAQPLILAGGLTPGNVAEAIRVARPWAVDVASGIESAPGIKDPRKLADFIDAVRNASR